MCGRYDKCILGAFTERLGRIRGACMNIQNH